MGSDDRIDQLEGSSPESYLSWLNSHEGCPKHDLFTLEYSICARLRIQYRLVCIKRTSVLCGQNIFLHYLE